MQREAAELILAWGDDALVEIREGYRGRYRDTDTGTWAIIGVTEGIEYGLARVMEYADQHERTIVALALRLVRKDSMGLDVVWY